MTTDQKATLTFLGAARQVTGSCYLIAYAGRKVLLECGIVQGERNNRKPEPFAFEPQHIDAVVLSHAHLDHSGRLPELVRYGFNGPIYMTRATHALVELLHKDAAHLALKDTEWENRRRQRAGKRPVEPPFTLEDVDQALALRAPQRYRERFEVVPGIEARFLDAGHILGSAVVELWVGEGGAARKLVFSGDLGNDSAPLMPDPEHATEADLLLLESTYGDRDHRPLDDTLGELTEVLAAAAREGGNVLIPSFAVGRTQDLIYHLGALHREGALPQQAVFLDSPMAIEASRIYTRFRQLFNEDDPEFHQVMHDDWSQWLPVLQYSRTAEESMALNAIRAGAVIIAGSGMCNGGRIRHHLKHNLWRRETHLLISGFQARGTTGRAIIDGAKTVRLVGEEIAVRAHIHTLGGLSAHAGQSQLIAWAAQTGARRPGLYLVHGEEEKMTLLKERLASELKWPATMPSAGQTIDL